MVKLILFILYAFIFVFGASVGSFLNVIVYRVPNGISIAKGRSFCPKCNTQIKNYDLIPVISYLLLRGKCRNCKEKISPRYILVETFVGAIAVIIFMHYYFTAKALLAFAFCAILVTIALIDHDTKKIPNSLIIAIIPMAVLFIFIFKDIGIIERLIGFIVIIAPMYILKIIMPKYFSGRYIKLLAVSGFLLGWKLILFAILMGVLIETIYVIIKVVIKKRKKGIEKVFGPALCTGIFISLLYGEMILKLV